MKKILVADDELVGSLFEAILTDEGYLLEQAIEGQELLQKVLLWQPALIIMALTLRADSYKLSNQLKSDPTTQHIPIVLHLPGPLQPKEAAKFSHIDGFVHRPLEIKQILTVIKELIGDA